MSFEEAIKYAMGKLAKEKELWIIEELKPCFDYNSEIGIATLKESYRFKFQEIKDYKQKVKDAIMEFNSTPNVWLRPDVSQKAFAKLLKDLEIE